MSQISPPLRIALVATLAFVAVWMMFLRPKPEELPVTPAATAEPAVAAGGKTADSAAGRAVEKANLSAADADAKAQALADGASPSATAADSTAGTSATASAAPTSAGVPDPSPEALAQLPADVARAVRRDKVIALLFWDSGAADDRRVRRALRDIGRHDGKVFVKAAAISDLSRYAPITRGANVEQAPTLVVVDSGLRAESLVGYVARTTIRQALSDAIRAGR